MRNPIDDMLSAYVTCALWAETGPDGEPLDGIDLDLAAETNARMHDDCKEFLLLDADDVRAYLETRTIEDLGHDFWLTRNGHGTGFWDRGLGLLGERLTMRAQSFGECNLYVGDDNKIHAA